MTLPPSLHKFQPPLPLIHELPLLSFLFVLPPHFHHFSLHPFTTSPSQIYKIMWLLLSSLFLFIIGEFHFLTVSFFIFRRGFVDSGGNRDVRRLEVGFSVSFGFLSHVPFLNFIFLTLPFPFGFLVGLDIEGPFSGELNSGQWRIASYSHFWNLVSNLYAL